MIYETFYKTCPTCHGSSGYLGSPCPECCGDGYVSEEYIRHCNYENRRECEWGEDCRHCPDAEPVLEY